jgi:hypothetical protein
MSKILQACLTLVAIPFLALTGFLFLCIRKGLRVMALLLGCDLAWPPVLVADLEAQADEQEIELQANG